MADQIHSTPSAHVPGTERLFAEPNSGEVDLQFISKGDTLIVLVPQPSLNDPNDPLRWSNKKKWVTFINGTAYAFMGSVTGPIMAAMMIRLTQAFHEPLQRLTYANGATLICQGVGNIFWMPLAVKYGRRPVYLLSNILMCVACIWLGLVVNASYIPFLLGRAFLGLFEAPIESILPSTITDIFFLHERGNVVSIYGLAVLGGNELGPLFSALIVQYLGMDWAFYIVAMFIGLNCITMFFFMPETKYQGIRPQARYATDADTTKKDQTEMVENVQKDGTPRPELSALPKFEGALVPKRPLVHELQFWGHSDKNVSLRKTFLRPFVLLTYPTVLWACLIYGMSLGWNVILGATLAQLFEPQYGFDAQAQGLVFLSPFIGSLLATWLCGAMSDRIANYFSIRNDGIREPEMRLPTLAIGTFLIFSGTLVLTLTYEAKTHWIGPVIGLGIQAAGAQFGVSLAMSYALDCHQQASSFFLLC
ncbi:MFS general substrate transporter [Aaosphaeria arxii CBS 175.79]|uniref:MFS general substrate transporter n=1 Tax=Aaosphaeria arxii CBS 175.79 TaxID=1450172 RepID=A0A6A5XNC1_9PLEO|nr:MFS general substrate transporter [Aaosphaeria arxii CBS 175.79]KAF2014632.1 MFS general substrate transporter [Aaosphaeria arxii CBS 175.79]